MRWVQIYKKNTFKQNLRKIYKFTLKVKGVNFTKEILLNTICNQTHNFAQKREVSGVNCKKEIILNEICQNFKILLKFCQKVQNLPVINRSLKHTIFRNFFLEIISL